MSARDPPNLRCWVEWGVNRGVYPPKDQDADPRPCLVWRVVNPPIPLKTTRT